MSAGENYSLSRRVSGYFSQESAERIQCHIYAEGGAVRPVGGHGFYHKLT